MNQAAERGDICRHSQIAPAFLFRGPYLVERFAHDLFQHGVDVFQFPGKLLNILYPLEIGNDDAAAVSEYIGHQNDPLFIDDRVRIHRRRTVCGLYDKFAIELFRRFRRDLIFQCRGNENIRFRREQFFVADVPDADFFILFEKLPPRRKAADFRYIQAFFAVNAA